MRKRISIICVIAVLCGVAIFLVASVLTKTSHDVSWNLHGTFLTTEGIADEKVEFSVRGTLTDSHRSDDYDYLKADFLFPDNFPYTLGKTEPNGDPGLNNLQSSVMWGFHCLSYDKERSFFVSVVYALDLENGYMIAQWEEDDRILVASTDPDTDPTEILEHFSDFLERYKALIEKTVIESEQ